MEPIRSLEYGDEGLAGASGTVGPPTETTPPASLPGGVLSGITHLLVSAGPTDQVLAAVADALTEVVPHDTLTLFQVDQPLRILRPTLVRAAYAQEILAMGAVPYGKGITGTAAESRIPQLVNDAHLDPRAAKIPDTPDEPQSIVAVPLIARDELKGVLCLYRLGANNHFSLQEFKLAILFSELAALAIDNSLIRSRLETEVITDHLTALNNHRYFHERLAEELRRANRQRSVVGLLIYDIDDFKRVNDTYGHLVGDQVLQGVASVSRESCRLEDVICRIGGEEFGVILPGYSLQDAVTLAERLREGVASVSFPMVGRISVSVGVAEAPLHAASPRELITCADLALLEAKAAGKDRVLVFQGRPRSPVDGDGHGTSFTDPDSGQDQAGADAGAMSNQGTQARLAGLAARGELRSVAHLKLLHSLSARLNRLNNAQQIGEAITAELRSLIDYHNCRVYVLGSDGETLVPIAFRGRLMEYQGETYDALVTKVGEGLTGHVAETGETYYTPDANHDPYAISIPGTADLDESILAVPLLFANRVNGVVVLVKLGVDQFDEEDMRLLEALASSAAIAFENARLLEVEREAAEIAGALLRLSQTLTTVNDTVQVLEESVASIPTMLSCRQVSAWIREPGTEEFRLIASAGGHRSQAETMDRASPPLVGGERLLSVDQPFVLSKEAMEADPHDYEFLDHHRETLVCPMRWEPDGLGAFVISAATDQATFSPRDVQFARGIADITSLALGNARRFDELEAAYVSTVEALANALEAQDAYTEDHCRALAEMSMTVGAAMGLAPERLKVLELGALFHDIGKIGVPSEIIRKPGPLTASEKREMSRHPEIGAQILAPVPFLQAVRPIVKASHERWDGNGYPDGLRGDEIPIESRIVFVCDAFHAMTTNRPYRAALPQKEAIRRLKLASGTQFDPGVVSVFVALHASGAIQLH
jgi:diguanylate cyclase (GGDEF)-like protein/putative nucleotidyltransferase with HDIG domain